ncbi:hypothetical protein HNY73_000912 [Argiope bruennichi]|uniref:Uncharacterized protein n=1 Tax=Argiope bruennichi TaxID=94029 RepID=A0A8T0G0M6_ARGBR|nr:hypothetical protein HNY73_000912 [Argiope bruennichi]
MKRVQSSVGYNVPESMDGDMDGTEYNSSAGWRLSLVPIRSSYRIILSSAATVRVVCWLPASDLCTWNEPVSHTHRYRLARHFSISIFLIIITHFSSSFGVGYVVNSCQPFRGACNYPYYSKQPMAQMKFISIYSACLCIATHSRESSSSSDVCYLMLLYEA